jgi:hypothetical protein
MLDGPAGELLGNLGASALAGLAVLSILVGWLVPLRSHKRELDAANARAEEWRTAFATERARADLLASHLADIVGAVKTVSREPT